MFLTSTIICKEDIYPQNNLTRLDVLIFNLLCCNSSKNMSCVNNIIINNSKKLPLNSIKCCNNYNNNIDKKKCSYLFENNTSLVIIKDNYFKFLNHE